MGRLKDVLLVNALVVAFAGFTIASWLTLSAWNDNRTIAGLAAGQDIAVNDEARPELLLARGHFLMRRGRLDEAQALVPAIRASGNRQILAALQYDLANARLRRALVLIEETKIDPGIALINLAKDGYRAALSARPEFWDARYNLDVAMRLVRDFPEIEQSSDEPPLETPERLWTDLPGLPRGLP
ncbi:hypothetical protein C5748_22485 [Phyllobacterium phragmitis]|uniref:MxaK protein n=1 Tax=Phyllobacterium phragmitis TaxID=2670329 RepID=A0A2S9ILC9_9HYPH|nr:hypothetical protein C5748_22485 [Phyllobacterium phragmitis]